MFSGIPNDVVRESGFSVAGIPAGAMRNARLVPGLRFQSVDAGTTDLYTVPAGRRAMLVVNYAFNPTGGSLTYNSKIKVSGTYYSTSGTLTVTAGVLFQSANMLMLEAGEAIAVTTNGAGLNIAYKVIEFDAASSIRTVKLLALVSGDNTLYTCPTGYNALLMPGVATTGAANGAAIFWNGSGGSKTLTYHASAAGVSASSIANRFGSGGTVADQAMLTSTANVSLPQCLAAGESVIINCDAIASPVLLWLNVMEFPA